MKKVIFLLLLLTFALPAHAIDRLASNPDVDGMEDVWEGKAFGGPESYPWLTSATQLYISSDDDADDQEIELTVLDGSYVQSVQTVTLSGNTFVAVTGTYLRINLVKNTNGTPLAGNVYVHTDATDGNGDGIPDVPASELLEVISIGHGKSLNAQATVPDGETGYIKRWCWGLTKASLGGAEKEAAFLLFTREEGKAFIVQSKWGANNRGSGKGCYPFDPWIELSEHTDVRIQATPIATDTAVFATYSYEMKPDER